MLQKDTQVDKLNDIEIEHAVQFLTFIMNDDVYGINLLNVREIIDYENITLVPMMPDFVAGVINLRGSVVPVVNLAKRFGEQPSSKSKRSSIVVLEVEHEEEMVNIGVTVDAVNDVLDILPVDIESTPAFGTKIRADFIFGVAKVKGELLVLLDINNILSIDELSVVQE